MRTDKSFTINSISIRTIGTNSIGRFGAKLDPSSVNAKREGGTVCKIRTTNHVHTHERKKGVLCKIAKIGVSKCI